MGGQAARRPRTIAGLPGCWAIGLMQLNEDVALPDWPMRWSNNAYSIVLDIDVPEGARVEQFWPKPAGDEE